MLQKRIVRTATTFLAGLFVLLARSGSAGIADMPKDLEYTSPLPVTFKAANLIVDDITNLSQYFTDNDFVAMNERFGSGEDFFNVDQIFHRYSDDKTVYLLLNVAPKGAKVGTLYKNGEDFLYHGVTPNGLSYALYFDTFQQPIAESVVEVMEFARKGQLVSAAPTSLLFKTMNWIIPSAQAGQEDKSKGLRDERAKGTNVDTSKGKNLDHSKGTNVDHSKDMLTEAVGNRSKSKGSGEFKGDVKVECPKQGCPPSADYGPEEKNFIQSVLGGIANCTLDILCGAYNSTIGFGLRTLNTVGRMLNPSKWGGDNGVWANTKRTFRGVFNPVAALFTEGPFRMVKRVAQQWREMPNSEKRRAICEWIGEVAGSYAAAHYIPMIKIKELKPATDWVKGKYEKATGWAGRNAPKGPKRPEIFDRIGDKWARDGIRGDGKTNRLIRGVAEGVFVNVGQRMVSQGGGRCFRDLGKN